MASKYIALAIAMVQTIQRADASDYWQRWSSKVDPTKASLPEIPQTTSDNEAIQCTWYDPSALFELDPNEWPITWELATSNGMDKSAEFLAVYNSIDWAAMPSIPIRRATPNGGLDMSSYDQHADPDCWWSATTCTSPKHAGINPDIYRCPEPETWGLSFDDGPNCSHNAFYDYLLHNKLTASMFYIGSNVISWPYGAIRGVRDGHHLASHTWSHTLMTTLTNKEILAELFYTQKAIKTVTGVTPRYWRPAFGDIDDRVRWIATQLDMTAIIWDLDTDDWAAGVTEPASVIKETYRKLIKMGTDGTFAKHGNIVLQHEINNTTMQLALDHLPQIQANYRHVTNIATCMNITYPYMETSIKFPSFAEAIKAPPPPATTSGTTVLKTTSKLTAATTTKKHPKTAKKHPKTARKKQHIMTTTLQRPTATPTTAVTPKAVALAAATEEWVAASGTSGALLSSTTTTTLGLEALLGLATLLMYF
ncbi:hypothetical protein BX666DRAFT_2033428 [Dichotomocladium elegans]|nr:hypothetical protein BX666DRAFT_2033428 [Dichotomocladium elegans]